MYKKSFSQGKRTWRPPRIRGRRNITWENGYDFTSIERYSIGQISHIYALGVDETNCNVLEGLESLMEIDSAMASSALWVKDDVELCRPIRSCISPIPRLRRKYINDYKRCEAKRRVVSLKRNKQPFMFHCDNIANLGTNFLFHIR